MRLPQQTKPSKSGLVPLRQPSTEHLGVSGIVRKSLTTAGMRTACPPNDGRLRVVDRDLSPKQDLIFGLARVLFPTHSIAISCVHRWTKDSARVVADALDALGRVAEAAAIIARYGLGQDP